MEKKLTDEEVNATVKSLKWLCNQIPNDLGNSNEEKMLKCIQLYCEQGISLIHRLQDENERLTEERQSLVTKLNQTDEAVDYWCDKFKAEKAEIERLASVNMQTIGKNADLQMKVDEYYQRAFVYYKKCKAYGMDFKDEEFEIQAKDGKVFKMPKFTTNEEEVE